MLGRKVDRLADAVAETALARSVVDTLRRELGEVTTRAAAAEADAARLRVQLAARDLLGDTAVMLSPLAIRGLMHELPTTTEGHLDEAAFRRLVESGMTGSTIRDERLMRP